MDEEDDASLSVMGGARLEPAKDSVSIFSCCVVRKTIKPKMY